MRKPIRGYCLSISYTNTTCRNPGSDDGYAFSNSNEQRIRSDNAPAIARIKSGRICVRIFVQPGTKQ